LLTTTNPSAECLEILLGLSGYEVLWRSMGRGREKGAECCTGPDLAGHDHAKLSGFDACKIIKGDPVLQKSM